MRKLRIFEHASLDGVIEAGGDFRYGDGSVPYRTPAGRDMPLAAYGESFDLPIGRRTYDLWSGFALVDGIVSDKCADIAPRRWRALPAG